MIKSLYLNDTEVLTCTTEAQLIKKSYSYLGDPPYHYEIPNCKYGRSSSMKDREGVIVSCRFSGGVSIKNSN